jgi:fructan beta-fructosidase
MIQDRRWWLDMIKGNNYFIDRTLSGKVDFEKGFAAKHIAPRLSGKKSIGLTLMIDNASVELFADKGLTGMTEIFFPGEPFSTIIIQSQDGFKIKSVKYNKLNRIFGTNPKPFTK